MYLGWVAHDGGATRMQPSLDDDVPRQFGSEQRECFPRDRLDMHRDPLADSAAAEREDAFDQRAATLAGDHHAFDIATQATAGADVAKRQLSITEYRAQQIIEVMSDAAGKRTEPFQTLSPAQLSLNMLQFLRGTMAIGHVEHESDDARGLALRIEEHAAFRLEPPDRAAGVQHPVFGIAIAGLLRRLDRGLDIRPVFRVDKLPPRLVRSVVGTCWNPVHGFQIGRPAVLPVAGVDSPLERRGA